MADTLNGIADLARDDGFRQRVRAAMTVTARDVGAEAGEVGDEYYDRRRNTAKEMLHGTWVEDYVEALSWLAASNPAIKRASSDGDLQWTVNAMFATVAACGPPPAAAQSE